MLIAVVVLAVVAALACAALAVVFSHARAAAEQAQQAQKQLENARVETAQATADLDTARGELTEARAEAKAAHEEAAGARAEAQAQRTEATGARADADAARAELAESRAALAANSGTSTGALGEGAGEVGAGGAGAAVAARPGREGAVGSDALGFTEGGYTAPTLAALWSLARIRQEWLSRQVASLTLEGGHTEGSWAEVTLTEVLDEEVSRIREETGTPGALRTALHDEPPAGQSMLLLAGVQALLEALARHCQAYDLYVHLWEDRLAAVVVCESFDGPDRVASDTEAVLSAIAPAGGELALDRDQQGRLRARLSLPLHSPV